eukprot:scaffold38824_cov76-Phaeocystis_antarctica.AAC.1
MSATIESEALAALAMHALAEHVYAPSLPQEDISPILVTAPMHVLSDSGLRAVVRPHALNVERNEWVNVSAVRTPYEAYAPVHVAKP